MLTPNSEEHYCHYSEEHYCHRMFTPYELLCLNGNGLE